MALLYAGIYFHRRDRSLANNKILLKSRLNVTKYYHQKGDNELKNKQAKGNRFFHQP